MIRLFYGTGNLLILRNGMDLTPDRCEVTQQRLIDLLAFRLFMVKQQHWLLLNSLSYCLTTWWWLQIEDDKEEHFENKAQNIMDAMELLPRLAYGIDVNVKFRRLKSNPLVKFNIEIYSLWLTQRCCFPWLNAVLMTSSFHPS